MKWDILLALLSVCFLAADSLDDANKKDIEAWQGTWRAVSMENNGTVQAPEQIDKIRLTVTGTSYHFQSGSFNEHGVYKFNAAKSPKQLDIVVGDGQDKGKVHLVIYKIEGDRLTLCFEAAGQKRPGQFTGAAGSGCALEVFERVKPAKSEFARDTIDLGVVVSDVAKSVKFYTEAIGFSEQPSFSVSAEFCADAGLTDKLALDIRVLALGPGDAATKLKLMQVPGAASKKNENQFIHSQLGYRYLTIYVADLDASLARLQKAAVKPLAKGPVPLPPGFPQGMALVVVRDPDGNMIELIGPKR